MLFITLIKGISLSTQFPVGGTAERRCLRQILFSRHFISSLGKFSPPGFHLRIAPDLQVQLPSDPWPGRHLCSYKVGTPLTTSALTNIYEHFGNVKLCSVYFSSFSFFLLSLCPDIPSFCCHCRRRPSLPLYNLSGGGLYVWGLLTTVCECSLLKLWILQVVFSWLLDITGIV